MTTTNRKTLGNSRLRKLMGVFDKHRHTHTPWFVQAATVSVIAVLLNFYNSKDARFPTQKMH